MADDIVTEATTGLSVATPAAVVSVTVPAQSVTIAIPAQTLKLTIPATTDPVTGAISLDLTTLAAAIAPLLPQATGGGAVATPTEDSVIDQAGNAWSINAGGQVTYQPYNAATKAFGAVQTDTSTAGVTALAYFPSPAPGKMYQQNGQGLWWYTLGFPSAWVSAPNPYVTHA
jgi:hypothetical protein